MADVFISYHQKSTGEIVKQIATTLSGYGISCCYAEKEIYETDSVGWIAREIRNCKVFLLILNQGAMQSRYVENEVALAFRRSNNYEQMTVVTFRVDDCDLDENPAFDYLLRRVQIMNGNPPNKAHIEELAQRISRLIGAYPPQTLSVPPRQHPIFLPLSRLTDLIGKFVKNITFFLDRTRKRW